MQLNQLTLMRLEPLKLVCFPILKPLRFRRIFGPASLPSSVLDPVFSSSSGGELCSSHGIECLSSLLLSGSLLTPNLSEAQRLADLPSEDSQDLSSLSNAWLKLGAKQF